MNILDRIEQMEEPERAPSFLMQNKISSFSKILFDSYTEHLNESQSKERIIESDIIDPLP